MKPELEKPVAPASLQRILTLWLVDDDAEFRQMFADGFNRTHSLKCTRQFSAAEEVLAALALEPAPDLILSDVHMNGMSGVEAIPPIKHLAPSTHVILFTSIYNHQLALDAYRAGAAQFLSKIDAFRTVLKFAHSVLTTAALPLTVIRTSEQAAMPRAKAVLPPATRTLSSILSSRINFWRLSRWLRSSLTFSKDATASLRSQPS